MGLKLLLTAIAYLIVDAAFVLPEPEIVAAVLAFFGVIGVWLDK